VNGEPGDLITDVERFSDNDNEEEEEDGPDWMFEEGEKHSTDPNYVFCPAPHRKFILQLFTKHFCQHPVFLGKDGPQTATDIRREAVHKMYQFCHMRGLHEAWGYLWTLWYAPEMWKLWARLSSPYVSRLQTTMNVENFWKQLKHGFLHNQLRPQLDQLVWILVTKVTPSYLAHAQVLDDGHWIGRSKALSPFCKQFKALWKALSVLPISVDADKKYITRINKWTCMCESLKFHSCHLCKHLVQGVPPPPPRFWTETVRWRTVPLYRHPALVLIGEESSTYIETIDGSITDGDDHGWSGNPEMLEGGGGWRNLDFMTPSLLGKRALISRLSGCAWNLAYVGIPVQYQVRCTSPGLT
jgi:hypothetical protein